MSEVVIKRRRGDPLMDWDIITGTTTITISAANVTANSANITFDPLLAGVPLLIGVTYSVARTGTDQAVSVETLTLSQTTLAFTGKASTAPGGADTTIITVRYTLLAKVFNS